jgi:hypothetical protein
MSIETDLYSTLINNAGVAALVSARIYPPPVPESAITPYLFYEMITGARLSTITGVGDAKRKRIQIDCVAGSYAEAKTLAAAVFAALEGNGYLETETDAGWSAGVQRYTVAVDWSFMAP